MLETVEQLAPWLIGLIFQAGMLYAVIYGMRKQLNGVGTKVRGIQEANEQRYLTTVVVSLMAEVPKENRDVYIEKAKLFLEAARGRNL